MLAAAAGDLAAAARYMGAADRARPVGAPWWRPDRQRVTTVELRAALGHGEFEHEFTRGRALDVTAALDSASQYVTSGSRPRPS